MVHKVLATAVILLVAAMPAFAQKGKLKWQKNPYQAMKDAKARGVPMLLYFTSNG